MITFANIPKNNATTIAFGVKEIGPYYWIGSGNTCVRYYAGQTFKIPATGTLKKIKLFFSIVSGDPNTTLSIYSFDNFNYTFLEKFTEVKLAITKADENRWIDFNIPELPVKKDAYFAFKLSCNETGMLAIAECPWNIQNPYRDGVQWTGSSLNEAGSFSNDFDFAFEGEIELSPNAQFI